MHKRNTQNLLKLIIVVLCFSAVLRSSAHADERKIFKEVPSFSVTLPHPRIIFTKEKQKTIERLLTRDKTLQQLSAMLKRKADSIIMLPQLSYPNTLMKSREHIYRIVTTSLAYRLSNDNRYQKYVENTLLHISNWADWHPTHYLDVAETTVAVSIGYDWIYETLSPDTRKIIANAIKTKALDLAIKEYKVGNSQSWAKRETNWNVVCNSGMLIGALAVQEDYPAISKEVINNSVKYPVNCLKHFAPDGVCYEGPAYWSYTLIYFSMMLDVLKDNFNHDFGLSDLPGLSKTASYYINTTSPTSRVFNFGNTGDIYATVNPLLMFLSSKYELNDVNGYYHDKLRKIVKGELNPAKWHFFLAIPWYVPEKKNTAKYQALRVYQNTINPIVVLQGKSRSESAIHLMAKGGKPNEAHQQLDAGSFVVEMDGVRWLDDLGSDNYDLPGFWDYRVNGQRWLYTRNQNYYHNTLSIDNQIQRSDGKAILKEYNYDNASVVFDLSKVYTNAATDVKRGFQLLDDRNILVQDKLTLLNASKSIEWNAVTSAEVSIDGNTILLSKDGKKFYITLISSDDFEITKENIKPHTSKENAINGFTRVVIRVNKASESTALIRVLLGEKSNSKVLRKIHKF